MGGVAAIRLAPQLSIGTRVEQLWPTISRGRSSELPSIEERFTDAEAPGLDIQTHFRRYQPFAQFSVPAGDVMALNQGTKMRLAYSVYDDRARHRFTFRRLDAELQQRFAVLGPHRTLTLHAWTAVASAPAGQDIPFFLQPTLGGKAQVVGVREDLIGSDDTRATLRGYQNLRFRDRDVLLLQAEYRIPIWGPFDSTVFVDAGKVASRAADLNLSDLRRSYGFSFSVMHGRMAAARVDVGFGSREGTRLLVSVGDFVP